MCNSNILWCEKCQVPLIGESCDICGNKGIKPTKDIRPIFPQEHDLLEKTFKLKLPRPMYYNKGRYIHNGETVGLMRYVDNLPTLKISKTSILNRDIKYNESLNYEDYTQAVVSANINKIKELESEAIQFIRQMNKKYGKNGAYVAFSGGKDSTVVANLVKTALGEANLFFGDTTIEFTDTYDYIERIKKVDGINFYSERSDKDFFDLCKKLDPPSQKMRWCCTVFKAHPLNNFLNEHKGKTLFFDGIRKAESSVRSTYERVAGNKKASKQITTRPILEWSTFAVWIYIFYTGIDFNNLYNIGYGRAGCMYCPYNTKIDDFLFKIYYNDKWEEFKIILRDYVKDNYSDKFKEEEFDTWVNNGWKYRLPHRKSDFVASVFCKEDSTSYSFSCPIEEEIIEFLKPLGDTKISHLNEKKLFKVKEKNMFSLTGVVGSDGLVVKIDDAKEKKNVKNLIEKQLNKYLNCVKCGGCVGICPNGAISVNNNEFKIDEKKCTQCNICINTKFVGRNCVSLSYGSRLGKIDNITASK